MATVRKQLLPVEAKSGKRLLPRDAQGLLRFPKDNAKRTRAGLVLYDGDDVFWLAQSVLAAPWWMVI